MLLGWFCLFLGIRQHINHVAYSYAREIIFCNYYYFFEIFKMLKRRERNELSR
jgi:hypothetical protein